MLAIEHLVEPTRSASERLVLDFDARSKSRLRARLASGEECGLFLPRGTVLRGGDKLEANDGRIVEVVAAAEPLMEALSGEPLLLTRAAYHLGNRHVAVEIKPGRLRFCADHVLGEMVRGLGLKVTAIEAPFEPESGAYAHNEIPAGDAGHRHGAVTTPGAKIHQYGRRP